MSAYTLLTCVLLLSVHTLAQTVVDQHYEVQEGLPVGTVVGKLPMCSGHSALSTSQYSLQDPDFTVTQNGMLQLKRTLDREAINVFMFTVTVSQTGRVSCKIMVHIDVGDINDNVPTFTKQNYHIQLFAPVNIGDVVGTIKATDQDMGVNAAITYSFGTASSAFKIDGRSGNIQVVDPTKLSPVNEQVLVHAKDGGRPPLSTSVYIHIMPASVSGHTM